MEADGDFCAVGEAGAPVAPFFGAADAGVAGEAFAVDGWCGADEADPVVPELMPVPRSMVAWRLSGGWVVVMAVLFVKVMVEFRLCR